jgi:hypothetical protein
MRCCTQSGCGGVLFEEPVYDQQHGIGASELQCLLCGRSPLPLPDFSPKSGECQEFGCGRVATSAFRCPAHAAAFARIGTRRVG